VNLRPHQELAINMLRQSIATGHKRPILAAPTSFGKTITAAAIIKNAVEKGKKVVFICDRITLVEQALESFDDHKIPVGVMQADHWRTDYSKPVQICSIQTLAARAKAGKRPFEFDLAIVDECHTVPKYLIELMERYNAVIFIGLSATPMSRGLGKYYDDLIVPITPRDLLAQGYLCPADYYAGRKIATEGVRSRTLPTGGRDYDERDLAEAIEKDELLNGDIIKNWKLHAEGRQTVAFTPSIRHSKQLVEEFRAAGIGAEHIDGYMDKEHRQLILDAHDRGEFLILSCSRLLNTGWDSPKTSCLIDAFPTRSKIIWVQRIGRILRTAPGKENAIVLSHTNNLALHGFAEDIVPAELDDGEKQYDERSLTTDKDKPEPKVRECPQCYREFIGLRCSCGYEVPIKVQLETTEEELQKVAKVDNKAYTKEQKQLWYGGLVNYARSKGYNDGWAKHKYKEKFGVWPNKIGPVYRGLEIPQDVRNWITSQNIRWAKRKSA
jgi:superfamily II DNA or RNA helicase